DYRPALRERSGSGEYTHQLARALLTSTAVGGRRRDLDVTLFSSSWKHRFVPEPDLASAAIVDRRGPVRLLNLTWHRLEWPAAGASGAIGDRRVPVRLLNLTWHRLEWPPAEMLTGARSDVVHSPHPLLMPSRHAAQVITIHDLNFLSHPERTRAEIRRDYPS